MVSVIASIASLVLAILAVWLSLEFFKLSSAASKATEEAAKGISASVERLEKLFDKLYSDTFSMMRDTVTDMRKHIWKEPSTDESISANEELRAEITNQIDEILSKRSGTTNDAEGLKNELERTIEEMFQIRESRTSTSNDLRILKLIKALGKARVDRLTEILEESSNDIAMGLFRLRRARKVTWEGQENVLSSDTVILPTSDHLPLADEPELRDSITEAIISCSGQDGWAFLGTVGNHIKKTLGNIDYTQFGYESLYNFLRADNKLEFDERGGGPAKSIYVRVRRSHEISTPSPEKRENEK